MPFLNSTCTKKSFSCWSFEKETGAKGRERWSRKKNQQHSLTWQPLLQLHLRSRESADAGVGKAGGRGRGEGEAWEVGREGGEEGADSFEVEELSVDGVWERALGQRERWGGKGSIRQRPSFQYVGSTAALPTPHFLHTHHHPPFHPHLPSPPHTSCPHSPQPSLPRGHSRPARPTRPPASCPPPAQRSFERSQPAFRVQNMKMSGCMIGARSRLDRTSLPPC